MQVIELKEILNGLPTLEERLRTWKPILVELDRAERSGLESCIAELESNNEFGLDAMLSLCQADYDGYKGLIEALLDRLQAPIKAYKERLEAINGAEFRAKCTQYRKQEEIRCEQYSISLAEKYLSQYNYGSSKWDYVNSAKSMVTGFLFQPGIFPAKDSLERKIRDEVFTGFNPEKYAMVFYKKITELFKNVN